MGRIGSGFVTANSITMVIQRVSTIVIMGLAFSGCFQTGQVLGKGEVQAARRQGNTYLLIGLVFGALASVIIRLISGTVISLYKITPETREIAMELMDALCIVVVFRSVNSILSKGRPAGRRRYPFSPGGGYEHHVAGGRAAGRIGGAYPEAATIFYLSLSVFRTRSSRHSGVSCGYAAGSGSSMCRERLILAKLKKMRRKCANGQAI